MSMKRVELIFPSNLDKEQESLFKILADQGTWIRFEVVDPSHITCLLKSLSAVLFQRNLFSFSLNTLTKRFTKISPL